MGFKDEFIKAQDKGKTKTLTRLIHTWEEEGEELFGRVVSIEPFTEGQFDTEVNSYQIETDIGIVTTVLGSATDKQLAKIDPVGMKIYIKYNGKKMLKGGNSVNLFHIEVA